MKGRGVRGEGRGVRGEGRGKRGEWRERGCVVYRVWPGPCSSPCLP